MNCCEHTWESDEEDGEHLDNEHECVLDEGHDGEHECFCGEKEGL